MLYRLIDANDNWNRSQLSYHTTMTYSAAGRKTNQNMNKYVIDPNTQINNHIEPYFYYLTDHLGSSSYIANDAGQVTQTLAYLPFDEDWVNLTSNQPQYETPYKFSGKEKDEETGFNYYGARYYYGELSIWLSVDPMAHKYPHLSPYNYCANNPIMLIDPNGKEIWIAGEDGSKTQYTTKNMPEYKGEDKFTKQTIATLNQMKSTAAGGQVLSELDASSNVYNITNGKSEVGTAIFKEEKNGGTIKMNGNLSLHTLSHELFHGYQYEKGQGGASIFNEIEAYMFDNAITSHCRTDVLFSFGIFMSSRNPQSIEGQLYETSMINLFYGFSEKEFNNAVDLFKSQSVKNQEGIYNNTPLRRENQKINLIKQFYPLSK